MEGQQSFAGAAMNPVEAETTGNLQQLQSYAHYSSGLHPYQQLQGQPVSYDNNNFMVANTSSYSSPSGALVNQYVDQHAPCVLVPQTVYDKMANVMSQVQPWMSRYTNIQNNVHLQVASPQLYPQYHHTSQQQMVSSPPVAPNPNLALQYPSPIVDDSPVSLLVTNLDFTIGPEEWKKILTKELERDSNVDFNTILNIHVEHTKDGTKIAVIRTATMKDARLVIASLHRKKLGYKRVQVCIELKGSQVDVGLLVETIAILSKVKGCALPFTTFNELLRKEFNHGVNVKDLYKMRDVVEVKDTANGKTVLLSSFYANTLKEKQQDFQKSQMTLEFPTMTEAYAVSASLLDSSVCARHCKEGTPEYILALGDNILPPTVIKLRDFRHQLHKLLQAHNGNLPLMSLPACYKDEFGSLTMSSADGGDDSPLQGAVYLEHLVVCIPGVVISTSPWNVKRIQWGENEEPKKTYKPPKPAAQTEETGTSKLEDKLIQFGREAVELLKNTPGASMLMRKFVPAYHQHFGRQCRVADYGFSKLTELLAAISHKIHCMGHGNCERITLRHPLQVRRFASDLYKVVQGQRTGSVSVRDELVHLWSTVHRRPLSMVDYGVCYVEDMLEELQEDTSRVKRKLDIHFESQDTVVSLPRRDQSEVEQEKTEEFALEVVELLRSSPRCRLAFNKFIPAYHHHFGTQCRVYLYGFNKLAELLEAVPHTAEIIEEQGERFVCLTKRGMLKVLAQHTLLLLESIPASHPRRILLDDFEKVYQMYHGYPLYLYDYGVSSVEELIAKIPRTARVTTYEGESRQFVCLADRFDIEQLAYQVLMILFEVPSGSLSIAKFKASFTAQYQEEPNMDVVQEELAEVVYCTDDGKIGMGPVLLFARDLKELLKVNQGKLMRCNLEADYFSFFKVRLIPGAYGYKSLNSLLHKVGFLATSRGRYERTTLLFQQDFLSRLCHEVVYSTEPMLSQEELKVEEMATAKARVPARATLIGQLTKSRNGRHLRRRISEHVDELAYLGPSQVADYNYNYMFYGRTKTGHNYSGDRSKTKYVMPQIPPHAIDPVYNLHFADPRMLESTPMKQMLIGLQEFNVPLQNETRQANVASLQDARQFKEWQQKETKQVDVLPQYEAKQFKKWRQKRPETPVDSDKSHRYTNYTKTLFSRAC